VSGTFNPRQRAAYDAVLDAQLQCIEMCTAGTRYRDIHMHAGVVIARFLKDEGIVTCDVDTAVEAGVHALFFPHGVGHLIGMDVHDLENFGDRAAYAPGRVRADQFGASYLRLDLDLEPGMVVTVEPGFYVVPAILDDPDIAGRFAPMLNRDAIEAWAGFGGIRIEDDVAVTRGAPEVISGAIPKDVAVLEALVGTGAPALSRQGLSTPS